MQPAPVLLGIDDGDEPRRLMARIRHLDPQTARVGGDPEGEVSPGVNDGVRHQLCREESRHLGGVVVTPSLQRGFDELPGRPGAYGIRGQLSLDVHPSSTETGCTTPTPPR